MGTIATLHTGAQVGDVSFSAAQLRMIQRSVAPDLRPVEFDLFIEECRAYGLNPITKQIYAVVYNKDDEKKRNVVKIPAISGLRAMAFRTGRYRPDTDAARYTECERSEKNPAGLERAVVSVYLKDAQNGEWFPVQDEAWWEEYAPIEREWKWGDKRGERIYTGKERPTGNWAEMPRVMLAKCAEARALRKAFPELEGLYLKEEMGNPDVVDVSATEIVAAEDIKDRRALVGDRTLTFSFSPMEAAEAISLENVLGRLMDHIKGEEDLSKLRWFREHNKTSLKQFWAESPEEALEAKAAREAREQELEGATT